MALEKVSNILQEAEKRNTSAIAFDAFDYQTIYSCIMGAEAVKKPVILMLYPTMDSLITPRIFAETVKDLAKKVSVPVGLHLDHCSNYEYILSAIREGFTSVMADGSTLPFEQNVAFTKEVVRAATVFGVDVEGELGHVGSAGNESDFCNENSYTTPEDAAAFADATGVASLAVAIGRAHGHYVKEPKLDIERLREINEATKTPLVLHGGSGIPQEQLVAAFKNGINKFNVGTEYFILNAKLQKDFFGSEEADKSPFGVVPFVRKNLQSYIEKKLELSVWS